MAPRPVSGSIYKPKHNLKKIFASFKTATGKNAKPKSKNKMFDQTAGNFDSNNPEQQQKLERTKIINQMNNIFSRETLCAE
jgi:hypothetical protein